MIANRLNKSAPKASAFNATKKILKAILRALLPPIILRSAKYILRPHVDISEFGTHTIARRKDGSYLIDDKLEFYQRGSAADEGVIHQIFGKRDYELTHFQRFDDISSFYESCDNPLIVDCGANIGASVVWFSLEFPKAMITAIEPESNNFELLTTNTESLEGVTCVHGAVASKAGTIALTDPGSGEWGYRTINQGNDKLTIANVRAYTITELIALCPGTPFILKIDIEGAESDIFSKDLSVFDSFPLIIIELHDWKLPREANSRQFLRWHSGCDRDFIFRSENVFSFSNRL